MLVIIDQVISMIFFESTTCRGFELLCDIKKGTDSFAR